jgi:hypothetical protein
MHDQINYLQAASHAPLFIAASPATVNMLMGTESAAEGSGTVTNTSHLMRIVAE